MGRSELHSSFRRCYYPIYFRGETSVCRMQRWVSCLEKYLDRLEQSSQVIDGETLDEVNKLAVVLKKNIIYGQASTKETSHSARLPQCREHLLQGARRIQIHLDFCKRKNSPLDREKALRLLKIIL